MKRFLIRAGVKIGRFFWSWGFLKFVLWSITIIVLLYAEEDWRGARAWAATKAEWEAKGESFDYSKFIPPLIPDGQNLAAIPLFKLESTSQTDLYPEPIPLRKALRRDLPGNDLPQVGNWMTGTLPDLEKIRQGIATNYSLAFKGTPLPADTLVQLEALYPFLADLRAASATRPLCRFPINYSVLPMGGWPLSLITAQISVSKILALHATLALNQGKTDLALDDLRLNFKLMSGARRDPSVVGGLVAIGMNAICGAVIYNGLALHLWNDSQLLELDAMLKSNDFLADYSFAMRSDVAVEVITSTEMIKRSRRSDIAIWLRAPMTSDSLKLAPLMFCPIGWMDQNKSRVVAEILTSIRYVDSRSRRVFPQQIDQLTKQAKDSETIISSIISATSTLTMAHQFSQGQVCLDEARIAIALERYRIAHSVYPDSLEVLAPSYITELPRDIVNGDSYHYKLRPDGTFLLYSVGWNEKDDGGKVVYTKERYAPMTIDYRQGDWVWPTPQAAPASKF